MCIRDRWNACYERFGLPFRNVAMICSAAKLGEVLEALRDDERYAGGGLGVGLKTEALNHLDDLDPLARATGAANLIRKTDEGRLEGHNTDGEGYVRSLQDAVSAPGWDLVGLAVVILGAGGTGRSIALALAVRGAEIVVLNRTVERAEALAHAVNGFVGRAACRFGGEEQLRVEAPRADVIVNVSTKGAAGPLEGYAALGPAPVPATDARVEENREASRRLLASVQTGTLISDVVLRDGPTPTLTLARALGLPTLDGVGMVIQQGVEAFGLIHDADLRREGIGRDDVARVMRQAVL